MLCINMRPWLWNSKQNVDRFNWITTCLHDYVQQWMWSHLLILSLRGTYSAHIHNIPSVTPVHMKHTRTPHHTSNTPVQHNNTSHRKHTTQHATQPIQSHTIIPHNMTQQPTHHTLLIYPPHNIHNTAAITPQSKEDKSTQTAQQYNTQIKQTRQWNVGGEGGGRRAKQVVQPCSFCRYRSCHPHVVSPERFSLHD